MAAVPVLAIAAKVTADFREFPPFALLDFVLWASVVFLVRSANAAAASRDRALAWCREVRGPLSPLLIAAVYLAAVAYYGAAALLLGLATWFTIPLLWMLLVLQR